MAWSKQEEEMGVIIYRDSSKGEITVRFKDGSTFMDDESEFIITNLGE